VSRPTEMVARLSNGTSPSLAIYRARLRGNEN
jgi:hypothetical protein